MFSTTVIIKFWKDRPPLDQIYKDIVEGWGVVGRFVMGLRDNRTLFVRFENASDMVMALSRDNSFIGEDSFKVYRWANCVDGDVDASITPVWIALPQLPDRCWFPSFFREAGNSIGTFLRVDHPTAAMAQPIVAHMCAEVDLSKDLLKKIGVKVKGVRAWQKIVYQNLPTYCVNCRMQGTSLQNAKGSSPLPRPTMPIPSTPLPPLMQPPVALISNPTTQTTPLTRAILPLLAPTRPIPNLTPITQLLPQQTILPTPLTQRIRPTPIWPMNGRLLATTKTRGKPLPKIPLLQTPSLFLIMMLLASPMKNKLSPMKSKLGRVPRLLKSLFNLVREPLLLKSLTVSILAWDGNVMRPFMLSRL